MPSNISADEREQLIQTVKMFEAIVASQPDDHGSLEILLEAYAKLEDEKESLHTLRRLFKAYNRAGMTAEAMTACESVLKKEPSDAEAQSALKELKEKAKTTPATAKAGSAEKIVAAARPRLRQRPEVPREDPDSLLGRFMVSQHIITQRQLEPVYLELKKNEANALGQVPAVSLIDMLQERGLLQTSSFLELLADKFHLASLPLAAYDVDADIVKMMPRDLCFKYLALPFDHLSRTLLMTTANPYVRPHFELAADKLNLTIQWYLNTPQEIKTVLQNVYRLDQSGAKED